MYTLIENVNKEFLKRAGLFFKPEGTRGAIQS
jgi:hypothetical protein